MDCDAARPLMDDELDPAVEAHLRQCAACRAERELGRRMATAVAAMPRVRAPAGLADRVMAELRASRAPHSAWRLPSLVLRPWEIGWLGAACIALIVVAGMLEPWPSWARHGPGSAVPARTAALEAVMSWSAMLRTWGLDVAAGLGKPGFAPAAWVGAPTAWWAAGFGLAFFLLLSWHDRARARPEGEKAHG